MQCPPEINKVRKGKEGAGSSRRFINRWPSIWCTPTQGLFHPFDNACEIEAPIKRGPLNPGPAV